MYLVNKTNQQTELELSQKKNEVIELKATLSEKDRLITRVEGELASLKKDNEEFNSTATELSKSLSLQESQTKKFNEEIRGN